MIIKLIFRIAVFVLFLYLTVWDGWDWFAAFFMFLFFLLICFTISDLIRKRKMEKEIEKTPITYETIGKVYQDIKERRREIDRFLHRDDLVADENGHSNLS